MAQEKFFTREFFKKSSKIQISYLDAASKAGITRRTAINRFKRDIENGYIKRKRTTYKCHRYKKLLDGKNIYFLTDKGKAVLGYLPSYARKEKERQKEGELLAALKEWLRQPKNSKKILSERILQLCPRWWARNPKLLQKTLSLLRTKVSKGYRVRSLLRWISSALKDFGVGFRRKQARRYSHVCCSVAFAKPLSVADSVFSSPYIAEGFGNLATLTRKGLDISEEAMLTLLRNGFDRLAMAAKVLLRIEEKRAVQHPNRFLSWLVALREPFSVLKKKKLIFCSKE